MKIWLNIKRDTRRYYYFEFWTKKHGVVLQSQGYLQKSSRNRGIISVRKNISDPKKYLVSANAFSLRAGNNREIGRSPKMEADQLEEVMDLLQKYGRDAVLIEADDRISASNETQLSNKES